ncbi:hypothetical protein AKJ16_DCAP08743 [Drosera capensis]
MKINKRKHCSSRRRRHQKLFSDPVTHAAHTAALRFRFLRCRPTPDSLSHGSIVAERDAERTI